MFSVKSKSRKSITILSAGAAALLLTGMGVSQASADSLTWNPAKSNAGGTNGTGTWNSSGTYWYDTTSTTGPVAWTPGDAAYFGTAAGGSSSYTVTLGSSAGTYTTTAMAVNSGNSYILNGGGGTVTSSGQLLANGNLTLENITVKNTDASNNDVTTSAGISQASGGTLTIGSGASLDINHIATGVYTAGTINVNSGGYLGATGATNGRIQINYGGATSGNVFNVNGGTVNMTAATGSSAIVFLSDAANGPKGTIGTLNVGAGGTGGSLTATEIATGGAVSQTGVLNVDSGKVTTNFFTSGAGVTTTLNVNGGTVTATNKPSITSASGGTTTVNLNGGILSVVDITEAGTATAATGTTIVNFNGGTLQENSASTGLIANPSTAYYTPSNLEVLNGGAVIDNNGFAVTIYNPLLQGTNADSTLSTGGLKVVNSDPGRSGGPGSLTLVGASTYTGATEITSGATLILSTRPPGQAPGAATIADTSSLQIDSGGTLFLNHDGVGTQLSVGGLNLQGGTIDMGFYGGSMQSLLVGSAAVISGTNIINLSDLSAGTSVVPTGTYTLISDTFGGLTGTFQFANGSDTGTLVVGSNSYVATLNNTSTAETLVVGAVPEPASVALLAIGAMGLLLIRRRKTAA